MEPIFNEMSTLLDTDSASFSYIVLWRFFQYLSKGPQDPDNGHSSFNNAVSKIDDKTWNVLFSIVRSQKSHEQDTPIVFFEQMINSLDLSGKLKVFTHIFRPLLLIKRSQFIRGALNETAVDVFGMTKVLGELLVHIARSHRIYDYELLTLYLDPVRNCVDVQWESIVSKTHLLDTLFAFIDSLPPGCPLHAILQAINEESAKCILMQVNTSNYGLLEIDSSASREDLMENRSLDALYTLICSVPQDLEGIALHQSIYLSSFHNVYYEHQAVHQVVEILFDSLYTSVRPLGGAAVIRSLVRDQGSPQDRKFWMDVIFCFLPRIALNVRCSIAASLESLFASLTDHKVGLLEKSCQQTIIPNRTHNPKRQKIENEESIAENKMIQGASLHGSKRPQRQSSRHVQLLTNHLYAGATSEETSEKNHESSHARSKSEENQLLHRKNPGKETKDHGKKRIHLRVGHHHTVHDIFAEHIEEIKRYGVLYDLLRFHAEMAGDLKLSSVLQSWKHFGAKHGIDDKCALTFQ